MRVLIDGENLRHQIAHVLKQHRKIADKNAYFKFDLTGFMKEVVQNQDDLEITYYTTRVRRPAGKIPQKLEKQIVAIGEANRRWIADLATQGIEVIKAGYLRVRESNGCVHCGKKTLVMQEKGVDVRVATDLILSKDSEKQVALVSSDSDLTPALTATKKAGVYIYYICYSAWLNRSVAAQAHKTLTYDDAVVLKYFGGKK